jgi:hypothetical protein
MLPEEAREALLGLGIGNEAADFYLFMLVPQIEENQELEFPPMDIPQHELVAQGFQIETRPRARKVNEASNQL